MADTSPFPADLLKLQTELHRARAEHEAYLAGLPWSVEPLRGWTAGERYSPRGDVADSPGWTQEQKEAVGRMWQELRDLAAAVVDHPHWATVAREDVVEARQLLKKQGRPAEEAA